MSGVVQVVRDVPGHWVGEAFPVRSLVSYANGNRYDPFLLLDYAGVSFTYSVQHAIVYNSRCELPATHRN